MAQTEFAEKGVTPVSMRNVRTWAVLGISTLLVVLGDCANSSIRLYDGSLEKQGAAAKADWGLVRAAFKAAIATASTTSANYKTPSTDPTVSEADQQGLGLGDDAVRAERAARLGVFLR